MALDGQLFADWLEDWLAAVHDKPVLRVKLPIAQDGRSNNYALAANPYVSSPTPCSLFFARL